MGSDALVLIVDDNERNLRLARDVLRFAGFRTIEATTAADGILSAASGRPDLILMDVRLPDMDGEAALVRLRSEPTTAGIPVVAVTSSAMMGDRDRLLSAGFDGYLEKPISVKEFAGQVRAYLRAGGPER
ncbi:MAG TPA: response regulator [Candidatus Limnocylindrales bacterium]|jgi:two-component system cell cycle response regulator DivK|nr:response regulator [Candidatus Limnocylindrales bacterium]